MFSFLEAATRIKSTRVARRFRSSSTVRYSEDLYASDMAGGIDYFTKGF